MQKITTLFIFILLFNGLFSQEWGIRTGLNAFAPIPSQIDSAAKGGIYPFLYAGGYAKWNFSQHFAAQIDLNYNRKSASYEAPIPQAETTVLITLFGGQQQLVNASYRGDIKGKMSLHYLDIPMHLVGTFGRWDIQIGSYYSRLLAGRDTGTVHIIIGNPGVEFSRDTLSFIIFQLSIKHFWHFYGGKISVSDGAFYRNTHHAQFSTALYQSLYAKSSRK